MLRRWWTNAAAILWPAQSYFNKSALEKIDAAIGGIERSSLSEVCFAAEGRLTAIEILRGVTAELRAEELFSSLRVWDTELNTGVLVYLLLSEKKFVILADRAVSKRISAEEFTEIGKPLEQHCVAGKHLTGVLETLKALGEHLETYFPRDSKEEPANELSNKPTLL